MFHSTLPTQKSPAPKAVPTADLPPVAKAEGSSLPKTKKYIPRSGPSPAPAPGDIITELKMQVGHPISKCHHAAKDNVDNFLLKGDSRQGLHLPDPSGFSRSDCQLSDASGCFSQKFPHNKLARSNGKRGPRRRRPFTKSASARE